MRNPDKENEQPLGAALTTDTSTNMESNSAADNTTAQQQGAEQDAQDRNAYSLSPNNPAELDNVEVTPENNSDGLYALPTGKSLIKELERLKQSAFDRLPTKEEIAAEQRRQRTNRIIASIGDAGSAIANLIGTSKGAPNIKPPSKTLTDRQQERADKISAERDKLLKEYQKYALELGKAKDDDNKERWTRRLKAAVQRVRERMAAIAQNKDRRAEDLHPDKVREQKGKADTAGEKAKTQKENTQLVKEKQQTEKGKRSVQSSQIRKNNAQAAKANRSGSGKKGATVTVKVNPYTGARTYSAKGSSKEEVDKTL